MIALYVVLIVALAVIAVVLVTPWRMSRADAFGCRKPRHVGCVFCAHPRISLDCADRGRACSACAGCDHSCHTGARAIAGGAL